MSTNGETADLMVREGIQITESVVKLAGLGAKNLAALLIAVANDNQKLAGKTTLKRLIQDGDELTIFSVKKEDLDGFRMEAKSYGVLYCPIINKMEDTGTVEIMAKAKDARQLNRIFERMGYPAPVKEEDAAAKKPTPALRPGTATRSAGLVRKRLRSGLRRKLTSARPSRAGLPPTKRQRTQRRKQRPQKKRSKWPCKKSHPNDKEDFIMSNIGSLVAEQEKQTEEFKARKTAEREELSEMTDTAIGNITQEPEAYLHYLDVQADNPGFSVSNVLLAMQQYPDVTVFNSVKGWNAQGRSVMGGETGIKVRVSENYVKNGRTHRGYKVGRVFDITQTTGNRTVSKTVLADNTPQMQLALRALLYKSPVKVNPVSVSPFKDGAFDAFYDPQRQIIDVSEVLTDSQTFAALAREIFRAKVHDHGKYTGYTREETELDATSASYMLCRSFGVSCEKPDATKLGVLYEGMEPQDARGILDSIQSIFREMQGAVQNEIAPQQEQKRAYNQPAR